MKRFLIGFVVLALPATRTFMAAKITTRKGVPKGAKRRRSRSWLLSFALFGGLIPFGSVFALTDLPSVFNASTGFDVQKSDDGWSDSTSFSNSGADPAVANTKWTSGFSMHPGQDYYTSKFVYVHPAKLIPGNADNLYVLDNNTMEIRDASSLTCNRRFVALPGSTLRFMQAGYTFTSSAVEVRSTAAKPFRIALRCKNSDETYSHLRFPLEAPTDAVLVLSYNYPGGTATDRGAVHTFRYTGDASTFLGKIVVDGTWNTLGTNPYECLALGTAELGGMVVLTNGSRLVKYDSKTPTIGGVSVSGDSALVQDGAAYTIGDLSFADGARVLYTVKTPASIAVTKSFSRGTEPVTLDFNNQTVFSWSVQESINKSAVPTNELFRFAADIAVSEDDFRVTNITPSLGGHLPVPYLKVIANDDGTHSLVITHRPVVTALKHLNMTETESEEAAWSDDRPSHSDADYYLCWISATQSRTGTAMETPIYVQPRNAGRNTFGGGSLTVAGGIVLPYASCTFGELVLGEGSQVVRDTGSATLSGVLCITGSESSPARIHPTDGTFEVASTIVGAASSVLRCQDLGSVIFSGDNSGFAGRLRLEGATTYVAKSEHALGGGNTTFLYNAIDLNGASTVLRAATDVSLSEARRGVLVRQTATVSVDEGCCLSIAAPITYASVLTKTGAGTLTLGAAPRFVDGLEATVPTSGANELVVSAGAVEVAHADALNGLAVTVAPTARIVLDDVEGELHDLGAKLTRWANPFAASGRVNVTLKIAVDAERTIRSYSRGVLSCATQDEAEAMMAKLNLVTEPKGYNVALSVIPQTTAVGTVYTLKADCARGGLLVVFR